MITYVDLGYGECLLLDHGANVETSLYGETPLHTAADRGDLEIADLLIAHGAERER